jgi:Glyoxalase/Bleomycin resistance protein/Dioxygenase superfamily
MKNKIILSVLICVVNMAYSQGGEKAGATSNSFSVDHYFSAVIVKNIDSSVNWYQSVLGLKTRLLPGTPQGIRVAILESPQIVIEMIENSAWADPKKLLEGKPEGTRIQGYFKIGFKITSMDNFLEYLKKLNVTVPKIYKDESGKRNFLVEDPDKNLVQFFE